MITELIGKRIKELRISNTGLSQEKFANEIAMDRTYFSAVEGGNCNKCKRQMCFLCSLKECSPDCALVNPETQTIVLATGEDISDRITIAR